MKKLIKTLLIDWGIFYPIMAFALFIETPYQGGFQNLLIAAIVFVFLLAVLALGTLPSLMQAWAKVNKQPRHIFWSYYAAITVTLEVAVLVYFGWWVCAFMYFSASAIMLAILHYYEKEVYTPTE